MKCISLWQPYASLIAGGHKRIETRSWRCPLPPGTLLAIHAAKKWTPELAEQCFYLMDFAESLRAIGCAAWLNAVAPDGRPPLPFGAVVCVVRVGECLSTDEALSRPDLATPKEASLGDYSAGRYAWMLGQPITFDPVPETGHQYIWEWRVPASVERLVRDAQVEQGEPR